MSNTARRAVTICASAAMALAAVAATASGRPSGSCHGSFFRASASVIHGSSGAGHIEYRLTVRNDGLGACLVHSHPGLQLLGAHGQHLPTHVRDEGPGGIAVIHPGGAVSAKLRFSPDIPGPGEPTQGPCEPTAHEMRVTLKEGLTVIARIEPPTRVCEHGAIQEHALS